MRNFSAALLFLFLAVLLPSAAAEEAKKPFKQSLLSKAELQACLSFRKFNRKTEESRQGTQVVSKIIKTCHISKAQLTNLIGKPDRQPKTKDGTLVYYLGKQPWKKADATPNVDWYLQIEIKNGFAVSKTIMGFL